MANGDDDKRLDRFIDSYDRINKLGKEIDARSDKVLGSESKRLEFDIFVVQGQAYAV